MAPMADLDRELCDSTERQELLHVELSAEKLSVSVSSQVDRAGVRTTGYLCHIFRGTIYSARSRLVAVYEEARIPVMLYYQ
jgi:hypothetical protein